MTQETALKILKTGASAFLTGEPGSGKSHTIREYVTFLKECGIEPAITASTGIAATHIHGMTIHSWSGIGIRKNLTKYDVEAIAEKSYVFKRLDKTQILIIDEVSMLDADTLESVDAVCREVKNNPMQAFGGMQVIFVGDFFQLPPISKNKIESSNFAYSSKTWRDAKPIVLYLSEQYRQDDKVYLAILGAIRKNSINKEHKKILNERLNTIKISDKNITRLYSRNENVDELNEIRLSKIRADEKIYEMESSGNENAIESLKRGCLSPEYLKLKIGAVVMCTKNNPQLGFVNGTIGEVINFSRLNDNPVIKTKDGKIIELEQSEWMLEENGKSIAKISQIPLRLAWAITIHKSQGMSLDEAVIDLSDVFEYGQGYVALSRLRRLSGLILEGINEKAFMVHPEILAKDSEFKDASEEAELKFENINRNEVLDFHKNFIRASGGVFLREKDIASRSKSLHRHINPKKSVRVDTREVTLQYLSDKKTVKEISKERELKQGTILSHIEDLLSQGRIVKDDLLYLLTQNAKDHKNIETIHEVLKENRYKKLKPIYEHFRGKYSYDTIRLAYMLFDDNLEFEKF